MRICKTPGCNNTTFDVVDDNFYRCRRCKQIYWRTKEWKEEDNVLAPRARNR